MLSSNLLVVVFAALLIVAAAYPDTEEGDEENRKGGRGGHGHHGGGGRHHHGGGGHHGRGGHGGRGHHHHHHHGLTFFKDLNETVQQQFIEIWRDDELSKDEKKAQINELAETVLSPEQLEEFRKNQQEREQHWQERKAEMDAKIAALSPNARAAAERIRALWHDETLSGPDGWKQKKQKVAEIKADLSDAENEELDGIWGRKHGGHKGGCMLKRLSFYEDLSEETKEKFKQIAKNKDLTREERKQQIVELAQEEFTEEQRSELERVMAEHEQQKKEREAEMDAKIAAMSPNAQVAAEKIRAIKEDDSLNWDEKKTQMRAAKEGLTDSEEAEVEQLRDGHHGGRHRRYGMSQTVTLKKVKVESDPNDDDDE